MFLDTGYENITDNYILKMSHFFTLGLKQNGHHFTDDILKCISMNKNFLNKISLKNFPYGLIDNTILLQIIALHQSGDETLSEAMMACFTDPFMQHLASKS